MKRTHAALPCGLTADAWLEVAKRCDAESRWMLVEAFPCLAGVVPLLRKEIMLPGSVPEIAECLRSTLAEFPEATVAVWAAAHVPLAQIAQALARSRLEWLRVRRSTTIDCGQGPVEGLERRGLHTLQLRLSGDPARLSWMFDKLRVDRHVGPVPTACLARLVSLALEGCDSLGEVELVDMALRELRICESNATWTKIARMPYLERLEVVGPGAQVRRVVGCPRLAHVALTRAEIVGVELEAPLATLEVEDAGLHARLAAVERTHTFTRGRRLIVVPELPGVRVLTLTRANIGVMMPQPLLATFSAHGCRTRQPWPVLPAVERCCLSYVCPKRSRDPPPLPMVRFLELDFVALRGSLDLTLFPRLEELRIYCANMSYFPRRISGAWPTSLAKVSLTHCGRLKCVQAPVRSGLALAELKVVGCGRYDPQADGLLAKARGVARVTIDFGLQGGATSRPLVVPPDAGNVRLAFKHLARPLLVAAPIPSLCGLHITTVGPPRLAIVPQPSLVRLTINNLEHAYRAAPRRAYACRTKPSGEDLLVVHHEGEHAGTFVQ